MTAELEELLAAAKNFIKALKVSSSMTMEGFEQQIAFESAITAFEAARPKIDASNPMPLIRVVMRGNEIPTSIYSGVEPLGDHNDVFKIEVYRVRPLTSPGVTDPYDFENQGLRKEP
jgi:hypothetical protein